jgi:hypothetical protein
MLGGLVRNVWVCVRARATCVVRPARYLSDSTTPELHHGGGLQSQLVRD